MESGMIRGLKGRATKVVYVSTDEARGVARDQQSPKQQPNPEPSHRGKARGFIPRVKSAVCSQGRNAILVPERSEFNGRTDRELWR